MGKSQGPLSSSLNQILPYFVNQISQKNADERKKKKVQELTADYNTWSAGQPPGPEGTPPSPFSGLARMLNAQAQQNFSGAEGRLLAENVIPYDAIKSRDKTQKAVEAYNQTLQLLPDDFKKAVAPISPLLQNDPEALTSYYLQWLKADVKKEDETDAIAKIGQMESQPGFDPRDPTYLSLLGKVVSQGDVIKYAKLRNPKAFPKSPDEMSDFEKKTQMVNDITAGKSYEQLSDKDIRDLQLAGLSLSDIKDSYGVQGVAPALFMATKKSVEDSVDPISTNGFSFKRWIAANGDLTKAGQSYDKDNNPKIDPQNAQIDGKLWPKFEKQFTKSGDVKLDYVRKQAKMMQGIEALSPVQQRIADKYGEKVLNGEDPAGILAQARKDWEQAKASGGINGVSERDAQKLFQWLESLQ